MTEVVHHVLLAFAVAALAQAAVRVASRVAPAGVERVVVAAVVGVSVAVAEALALGLAGLGADTAALSIAAGLTWLAARALLPAPDPAPTAELAAWWRRIGTAWRALTAAAAGAIVAWLAWELGHPSIGFDGTVYHYAEVAGWIANGRPGSILALSYDLPFGNYPVTDEVALTWLAGIARSWVPLILWNPAMLALVVAATLLTLRNLGVRPRAAALAVIGLAACPLVVRQLNEPQTDLPTLAWIASTAALATGAGRRPALLVPAVVGAGLALGTKTTSAVVVGAALLAGAGLARGRLRPLAGWLAAGLAGAFVVGGLWYARNLVEHGSPLWPFSSGPWGDPRPTMLTLVDGTFLQRPVATLDGRLGEYGGRLGGTWILLAGALAALAAAPLATRARRPVVAAGLVTVVAALAWSVAPGTGLQTALDLFQPLGWSITTLRYLLPTIFAATVTVALASRVPGPIGRGAELVLAAALAWSLVATAGTGPPFTPPLLALLVGAAAGLALGAVIVVTRSAPGRRARRRGLAPIVTAALVAAIGVALAPAARGIVARHADVVGSTAIGRQLTAWFARQPGFAHGHGPIAFGSRLVYAPLAGDRFTHRLELVPREAPCGRVRALARREPVVVSDTAFLARFLGVRDYTAARCLAGLRPAHREPGFRVYRP